MSDKRTLLQPGTENFEQSGKAGGADHALAQSVFETLKAASPAERKSLTAAMSPGQHLADKHFGSLTIHDDSKIPTDKPKEAQALEEKSVGKDGTKYVTRKNAHGDVVFSSQLSTKGDYSYQEQTPDGGVATFERKANGDFSTSKMGKDGSFAYTSHETSEYGQATDTFTLNGKTMTRQQFPDGSSSMNISDGDYQLSFSRTSPHDGPQKDITSLMRESDGNIVAESIKPAVQGEPVFDATDAKAFGQFLRDAGKDAKSSAKLIDKLSNLIGSAEHASKYLSQFGDKLGYAGKLFQVATAYGEGGLAGAVSEGAALGAGSFTGKVFGAAFSEAGLAGVIAGQALGVAVETCTRDAFHGKSCVTETLHDIGARVGKMLREADGGYSDTDSPARE